MNPKPLILLHGFASSGQGAKAQFLREKLQTLSKVDFHAFDFNPTPRDFEFMTITGMINRLRQYIWDRQLKNVRLIGSSMGALVGLHYAHRFGDVANLLLLAPALTYRSGASRTETDQWREAGMGNVAHYAFGEQIPLRYDFEIDGNHYTAPIPPPTKTLIVHGRYDNILPIENSRTYARSYPQLVQLIQVDSDHRLNDQLELIWQNVQNFSLQ
jgi:pimeloyl-ACP methyl ester carboxylesterase